jgi:hypothetical protein
MRLPRLFFKGKPGVYLCSSDLLEGVPRLSKKDKRVLKKLIFDCAFYSGFEIITYSITPRGFYVLLRSFKIKPLSDSQLLKRYIRVHNEYQTYLLHSKLIKYGSDSEKGIKIRKKVMGLMNDLTNYFRSLKVRFVSYYTKVHSWSGSMWRDRYVCRPVEDKRAVIMSAAGIVDALPVYKGNTSDPCTYEFCGLGDAVSRNKIFRGIYMQLTNTRTWKKALDKCFKAVENAETLLAKKILPRAFGNMNIDQLAEKALNDGRTIPSGRKGSKAFFNKRFTELKKYKKRFGHCDVPKGWKENPGLGKWLAGQRSRKRQGKLRPEYFNALDKLGVVWDIGMGKRLHRKTKPYIRKGPSYVEKWEGHFKSLKDFVKRNGYAHLPRTYKDDPTLANWVWTQRSKRSQGKLTEEQISKLDSIGFIWNPKKRKKKQP